MQNARLDLNTDYLPGLMLAEPIDCSVPGSVETCTAQLSQMVEASDGKMLLSYQPVSHTSTRFHLIRRVARFYDVEASGYFIHRQNGSTAIVGQARISPLTYAITLLFAALTVLFLNTVVALLFALLFLRMVMALVVCGGVCKTELVRSVENTFNHR